MAVLRTFTRLTLASGLVLAAAVLPGTAGASTPQWAPAGEAAIHPGVQTHTDGAECTSNFVFSNGTDVYLGQAAHCSGTGGATETGGCKSKSLPLGTPVKIDGAAKPGKMVYNSWLAMQGGHEQGKQACQYNDLALVKVDKADVGKVNPSIPFWGGPTGRNTTGTKHGAAVVSYGNSELRGGLSVLKPQQGLSLGDTGDGWSHTVATVTPGIPGDSGSAFTDAKGRALGVLSTLNILPAPGTNGVGDISHELAYANEHAELGSLQLVPGTERFRGPLP